MTPHTGMDAAHFDLAHRGFRTKAAPAQIEATGTLWEFVGTRTGDEIAEQLASIMRELAKSAGLRGVILGEVLLEAKARSIDIESKPMEDKTLEQRQNSWRARVPKLAGLKSTPERRRSPLPGQHGNLHTVWVLPDGAR